MSENIPAKPVVSFDEWSSYVRGRPEHFAGVDIETASKIAGLFDGMVTAPTTMVDGSVHVAMSRLYSDTKNIKDFVDTIHETGAKTYLLGVYPELKKIRMTHPL